jgi:hypothetical protein
MISTHKSSVYKQGMQVNLKLSIAQHSRDAKLMENLGEYLGCGNYYPRSGHNSGEFHVTSKGDILDKIIPFFDNYPLQGVKSLNFTDFKKVAHIMRVKGHLSKDGLDQILKIKAGMNKGRSFVS